MCKLSADLFLNVKWWTWTVLLLIVLPAYVTLHPWRYGMESNSTIRMEHYGILHTYILCICTDILNPKDNLVNKIQTRGSLCTVPFNLFACALNIPINAVRMWTRHIRAFICSTCATACCEKSPGPAPPLSCSPIRGRHISQNVKEIQRNRRTASVHGHAHCY